jgi:hypothetical protein
LHLILSARRTGIVKMKIITDENKQEEEDERGTYFLPQDLLPFVLLHICNYRIRTADVAVRTNFQHSDAKFNIRLTVPQRPQLPGTSSVVLLADR